MVATPPVVCEAGNFKIHWYDQMELEIKSCREVMLLKIE